MGGFGLHQAVTNIFLSVFKQLYLQGILEKGSVDIWTAVCYTIYTIYLSLCAQTADLISSKPFSRILLYIFV